MDKPKSDDFERSSLSSSPDSWRKIVLENALDAVVGVSEENLIVDWNHQAEIVFGWQKHEVLGRDMADIIVPERFRKLHAAGLRKFLETGEEAILNRRIEISAMHRSDREFPVELTVIPVFTNGRYLFYSFLRDITDKKNRDAERSQFLSQERAALQDAEAANRRLTAQYAVMSELATSESFEDVGPKILRAIGESLHWDVGAFWIIDEEEQVLRANHVWKSEKIEAPNFIEVTKKSRLPYGQGLPGRIWETKKSAWIDDVVQDGNFPRAAIAARDGLHGGFGFPIFLGKRIVGIFEFFSSFIQPSDPQILKTLSTLAGQIEQFLQRLQSESELVRSQAKLKLITDALPVLISYVDRNQRYQFANAAYEKWFGVPREKVIGETLKNFLGPIVYDGLAIHVQKVLAGELVEFDFLIENPFLGRRVLNCAYIPDVDDQKRVKGFIVLGTDITQRKKSADFTSFLAEVGVILVSSLRYEDVLEKIAKLAVPTLGDWCFIDVLENGNLKNVAVVHVDPLQQEKLRDLRRQFPPDWKIPVGAVQVLRTGQAELYSEVTEELLRKGSRNPQQLEVMHLLKLKSVMIVPLRARDKTFGTITLATSESGRIFSEQDLNDAQELAWRAGLAVENARLYSDSQIQTEKLAEALHARDEFLSIASHELKTPITSLKLQAQLTNRLLQREDPAAFSKDRLTQVFSNWNRQADRLSHLVEDMLDITRASNKKLVPPLEKINFVDVVSDALEPFKIMASSEQASVSFETSAAQMLTMGNPYRLEQVVTNLLTNALKYGGKKPIRVSLSILNEKIVLQITDQGIGIDQKNFHRIFLRFERAVPAENTSGLGLGLYIVRQILDVHGGTIRVESQLGKGSTFTVELPLSN